MGEEASLKCIIAINESRHLKVATTLSANYLLLATCYLNKQYRLPHVDCRSFKQKSNCGF